MNRMTTYLLTIGLSAMMATGSSAAGWQWPADSAAAGSVRIDTKVHFIDTKTPKRSDSDIQYDEVPFVEPIETDGFYNRPPGNGRYPVRVEEHRQPYKINGQAVYPVRKGPKATDEGTLDALEYCKCLATPDCEPRPNSVSACGYGKFLCCYSKAGHLRPSNTEFFNEVEDERPMLLPNREILARPFPPPTVDGGTGLFANPHGDPAYHKQGVLVGPDGPTGVIGPQNKPDVLVGPDGPTGLIGPRDDIGHSETAQRGVLVGPGGPTGVIGPYGQRPVLVGPGGPTGIIGPRRTPGILTGPGGPTGIIGPGRYGGTPVLVGPGGPTGVIGPGRPLLVGPGGRPGRPGPLRYYGN